MINLIQITGQPKGKKKQQKMNELLSGRDKTQVNAKVCAGLVRFSPTHALAIITTNSIPLILLHTLYFLQSGVRANSQYIICFTVISVFSIHKYSLYRK